MIHKTNIRLINSFPVMTEAIPSQLLQHSQLSQIRLMFTASFPEILFVRFMATKLSIQVLNVSKAAKSEVEFLYHDAWTLDSEMLIMQKVHEILSLIRNNGVSLHLTLEIGVKDPDQAIFLINKKFGQLNDVTIKNHKLTLREIEILGLIMLGYTNQQIAEKIFISYETVRSHRKHILEKTGARNTAALINYYHQTFFEK